MCHNLFKGVAVLIQVIRVEGVVSPTPPFTNFQHHQYLIKTFPTKRHVETVEGGGVNTFPFKNLKLLYQTPDQV